jgi:methionyl-tRNA formyltransferase
MKVIFLSANKLGYCVFPELMKVQGITIQCIVTLSSQSNTVMYDGIEPEKWKKWNIPVIEINNIGEEIETINKLSPDLILMCGWRQKIPPSMLNIPPKGIIGFHPTLLPIGRGPAPIINSILEGFVESGVTMFYLSDDLDSGDIIGQESFVISDQDNAQNVYNKVIKATKKLIKTYVPLIKSGNSPRIPQDHSKATYFPKRTLNDNEINLDDDVSLIMRKIRAFSTPYRGAYISVNNARLIIWNASIEQDLKDE